MKTAKKTRPDALLKTLSEERQAEIVEYMRTHSTVETSLWLKQAGLDASHMAVSRFGRWYQLSQQTKRNAAAVTTLLDDLKQSDPAVTEKELEQAGLKFFSELAIEQQDPLGWCRIERSKTQRGALELAKKKYQRETCELFLTWSANEEAKEIAAGDFDNSEKIEALGKLMFGEHW